MEKTLKSAIIPIIICALTLFGALPVNAQTSQWAVKMFGELGTERSLDFGDVALGANVEHHFKFKNIYDEDAVISSVSSNCGCTKATASKSVIRPGEIGEIIAKVDTSGKEHTKQRKATIRVMFSAPSFAEVQLQVKSYIRPDVGFEPGQIEFGTVSQGKSVVKRALLQYEGRSDWALTAIQKTNPGIRAEAREIKRNGGSVAYEILVELKSDARPGYVQDLLTLRTNETDRASSSIFLPIQGLVVEPLSAKPSHLQLGVIETGSRVVKNLVISGSAPFKIASITSTDPRLSFLKTDLSRSVHVVPVTFQANEKLGAISGTIIISTVGNSNETQKTVIPATGIVVNESATKRVSPSEDNSQTSPEIPPVPPNKTGINATISKPRSQSGTAPDGTTGWVPVSPGDRWVKYARNDGKKERDSVHTASCIWQNAGTATIEIKQGKVSQVSNAESHNSKANIK